MLCGSRAYQARRSVQAFMVDLSSVTLSTSPLNSHSFLEFTTGSGKELA